MKRKITLVLFVLLLSGCAAGPMDVAPPQGEESPPVSIPTESPRETPDEPSPTEETPFTEESPELEEEEEDAAPTILEEDAPSAPKEEAPKAPEVKPEEEVAFTPVSGDRWTSTALNLRLSPKSTGILIQTISKGEKVSLIARGENGWMHVSYREKRGYVFGAYLNEAPPTAPKPAPTPTPAPPAPAPAPKPTPVVDEGKAVSGDRWTTHALNMRTGASASHSLIRSIPKGEKVDLLRLYSNGWYKVRYAGKDGYVSGAYLSTSAPVATAPAPSPAPAPSANYTFMSTEEKAVLDEVNKHRREHGLVPLVWDNKLQQSARAHSILMFETGVFEHTKIYPVGENIHMRASNRADKSKFSAVYVVQAWMDSPPHRANILHPEIRKMGVGMVRGVRYFSKYDRDFDCLYSTQHFTR